jgi:ABC-2 type transport system ATP-binding protein
VAIIKEGKIIQIEDIETLRKKQLKKVHIEFEDQKNKENFNIPGTESVVIGPNKRISFMYSGNINELVSLLSETRINNLMIEEPSLDEIFMHYYKL